MKTKYLITIFSLSFVLSCDFKKSVRDEDSDVVVKDLLVPDSIYTLKSSETKQINWDSLQIIQPETWQQEIAFESVIKKVNKVNSDYKKTTFKIDQSRKKTYSLAKILQEASTIKIPRRGHLIQNNDTIFAIKKVLAGKPVTKPLLMTSKPNTTSDIQYACIEQGFPQNKIHASLVDNMGYIWFATYGGGVVKFDGNTVLNYTEEQGLSSNFINYINKDRKGNLWMGTDGGGITKFDGVYFWHYYYDQGLRSIFEAIAEDSKGDFWLGGQAGLAKLSNVGESGYELLTHFNELYGLEEERVNVIFEDSENTIWIGTSEGLRSFKNTQLTFYDIEMIDISGLLEDDIGNLWISSDSSGFAKFDRTEIVHFKSDKVSSNSIKSIYKDSSGKINIGTKDNGLLTYCKGYLTKVSTKNGLISNHVYGLTEDPAGSLWCSNFWEGVTRIGNSSFEPLVIEKNSELLRIHSFNQDNQGQLWLGSNQSIGYTYKDHQFRKFKLLNNDKNYLITNISIDLKSNKWFSSYHNYNLSKLNKNKITHYKLFDENQSGGGVYDLYVGSNESVWIAANEIGIIRLQNEQFKLLRVSDKSEENEFYKIVSDKNGNYYFFSYENVYVLTKNKLNRYETVGRYISDILISQDNTIWLSTNQGPVKIRFNNENELLTYYSFSNNGLSAGGFINSIAQNKNGDLWLTENTRGIQVLKQKGDAKPNSFEVTPINKNDGFSESSFFDNASFIDAEKNYWVGTKKGGVKLDLTSFKFNNNRPKVYLNSIHVNNQLYDRKKIRNEMSAKAFGFSRSAVRDTSKIKPFQGIPKFLELRPGFDHITFGFSAIEWQSPNDLKYQYKVDELDKSWSTPTKNNFADYRNIPHGKYSFRLRAAGKSGFWSDEIIYKFAILPPWWHSWLARLGYVLIAIVLLQRFIRWRTVSVRKKTEKIYEQKLLQQLKLEEGRQIEKDRVAKELHDGVLGSIFGIRLGLDDLDHKEYEQQQLQRKKYIKKLSLLEKEIRQLSHGLSPNLIPTGVAFTRVLQELIEEHCQINKLDHKLEVDSKIEWNQINDIIKFNLFRIIQESLLNIIKHSRASLTEIRITKKENILELKVSDNGIGFKEGKSKNGIGIKNITSRVHTLSGEVSFKNSDIKGALVIVKIPIKKGRKQLRVSFFEHMGENTFLR